MTMPEWGDDRAEGGYVKVRCVEPCMVGTGQVYEDGEEIRGCGWTGSVRCIKSWGLWQWETENCPNCDGELAINDN
jgi:hypothetical protein